MSLQTMTKKIEDNQLCKDIIRVNPDWYYVPSSEGQICYKVMVSEDGREYCSCEEYVKNMKSDPMLKCKHVLAVKNAIRTGEFQDIDHLPAIKPVLDERFITNIQGNDFVVYAGLLDLASQMGLKKLEVNLIQCPKKENNFEAICMAIAHTKHGEIFSDIGDANPNNCHKMVSKHILRMASTRAKARVLRDMTNVGMTCLEELGDLNEVIGDDISKKTITKRTTRKHNTPSTNGSQVSKRKSPKKEEPKKETKTPGNGSNPQDTEKNNTSPKISEAQKHAVINIGRRRNLSQDELDRMVQETFHSTLVNLSKNDASELIRQLQSGF